MPLVYTASSWEFAHKAVVTLNAEGISACMSGDDPYSGGYVPRTSS
jgi:hypothetical protein